MKNYLNSFSCMLMMLISLNTFAQKADSTPAGSIASPIDFKMHLVSYQPKPGTFAVIFPNDGIDSYADKKPLLTLKDFAAARIMTHKDAGRVLEITLTKEGLAKLNLAAQLNQLQGLGIFINARPFTLFQRFEASTTPTMMMVGMKEQDMRLIREHIQKQHP